MNILMVGDSDTKYGASRSLVNLAVALNSMHDNKVTVILNKESQISRALREGGCIVEIVHYEPFYQNVPLKPWRFPIKYVIRGLQYYYGRANAIGAAKEIIERGHFNIIHSNSSREDFSAAVAEHYKIPLVWHIREFGDTDFKCYSYRKEYVEYMNRMACRFIGVSNAVRLHWISKGIDAHRIRTIYDGVDSYDFEGKKRTVKDKEIRIVMTGSIQHTKGQLQAVNAVIKIIRNNPECKVAFDIVGDGDGPYIRKIERLIKLENVQQNVRLLGYITNVGELLPSYDIGLVCSRCEAFGRVTAEYMMAGLPVIASNTGANAELIRDGIDGVLYTYDNPDDLARKIQKVMDHLGQYGGLKTHDYAMQRFSAEENARNVYETYKEILLAEGLK